MSPLQLFFLMGRWSSKICEKLVTLFMNNPYMKEPIKHFLLFLFIETSIPIEAGP